MKLAIKLVVGLVLVVVLVLVAGLLFIDSIARTAIERGATYALGVETTLEDADLGVLAGRFSMAGLDVANPEGFKSPSFLTMGSGDVRLSLGSLRSETVELPLLALSNIGMTLEKKQGTANYQVIADNLKRFESEGGDEPDADRGGEQEEKGKDFVIREIRITNVTIQAEMPGLGTPVTVPIDEIRLENVGTGGRGVSMAQLSTIVVKAMLAAIVANAAQFPADLVQDLGQSLQGLGSLGEMGIQQTIGAVGSLGDAVKGLGDSQTAEDISKGIEDVGDTAGDVVEGLGGLLGGKKDGQKKDG